LPATPSVGDMVSFNDATNSFAVNNLTIGRNGSNINGDAEDLVCDINGMSISLVYANAAEGWVFFPQVDESAGVSLPRGYVDGLILSNNSGDASHDIDISAGCARDTTNTADCYLLTGITKQLDAAWAVGTGAGGLDTGAVGNTTWYHVWIIKRSDTGVVDVLFSTSATTPTMPANYDCKRRIGSVLTDGSANILAFTQVGDVFYYDTQILDVNAAAGPAGGMVTLSTPLGVVTKARIRLTATSATATDTYQIKYANVVIAGVTVFIANGYFDISEFNIPTNTLSQVYHIATDAQVTCYLGTLGWIDPRGKNS